MQTPYAANIVMDLEFTPVPRQVMAQTGLACEIIEVGAVKLSPDGTVLDTYSQLVRPTLATGVSGTVHSMTGIGNEDLACAHTLNDVLRSFSRWIGPQRSRFVTWSNSDRRQIAEECTAKRIQVALPHRWLDIQRIYPRLMGIPTKKRVALGKAADWCGITNDKLSAHRALYDAQMTAELFGMMASGACTEHRERMQAEVEAAEQKQHLSSSIGDRCAGLAELLTRLSA